MTDGSNRVLAKREGKSILGGGLSRCKALTTRVGTACRRGEAWGGWRGRHGVGERQGETEGGRAGGSRDPSLGVRAAAGPAGLAVSACRLQGPVTTSEALKTACAASEVEKPVVKIEASSGRLGSRQKPKTYGPVNRATAARSDS